MSKENFTARNSAHENGNAASANVNVSGNVHGNVAASGNGNVNVPASAATAAPAPRSAAATFLVLAFAAHRSAIVASLIATAIGAIAWIAMLTCGLLTTTNMSNIFNWGLLIAIFAFLVGFGAGAQFLASILYLRDQTRFRNLACYAQAISLAGGVGAGAAIVADLGSPKNMLNMILHPNPQSMLTWDMVALSLFLIVSLVCLVALARTWKSTKAWMIAGFLAALFLQVVEGLLFALNSARTWWHSPIMPIDFICVAFVCGAAALVGVCAVSKRAGGISMARSLSPVLCVAVFVHIVLMAAEFVNLHIENTPASQQVLHLLGVYAPLYAVELLFPLIAALALWFTRRHAQHKTFLVVVLATVIGMLAHRMMLLYPAFAAPTLFVGLSNASSPEWAYPIATGLYANNGTAFEMGQAYIPSLVEAISVLLPVGLSIALILVALNCVFARMNRSVPACE